MRILLSNLVFHDKALLSYFCQYLTTKISAWDDRGYMLQFSDFRANQRKKPCIRVNTRELNRELYIRLLVVYLIY